MPLSVPTAFLAMSIVSMAGLVQSGPSDRDLSAKIDAIFSEYDKSSSPGCAVAVYDGDRIAFKKAFGMANLDHDVKLTPSSIFHVASVSKQFTAAAILLLAQDGKLSIDDDVRKHLPELPDFGRAITIRQLANHTSGIRDQWDLLSLAGWRYGRDLITDDDVMELLTRQKALNFDPGERHLYSNSGFTLMALIVSRVSGQSFRAFTTEHIFKPLGMHNTFFRDRFADIVKNQAYGYVPADGGAFRLGVTNFDTAGATSLMTTVEDLLKWHANFDAKTVGGEGLQAKLLERGQLNSGRTLDYAFGITHGHYRGFPTVGHGGSDAGYRADFVRFPAQRLGIATLCNASSANPNRLSRRVADLFLPAGAPSTTSQLGQAAPSREDLPEVPIQEAALSRFVGTYWNANENALRAFRTVEGTLYLFYNDLERVPLKHLGHGTFVENGGPPNRVVFHEQAGRAIELTIEGSNGPFIRTEPYAPTPEQLAEFAGTYRSDEMDAVFRLTLHDGGIRLERTKLRPSALRPLIKDTFRVPPGVLRFTRDETGRVTGFVLQGNRIKNVAFWKER